MVVQPALAVDSPSPKIPIARVMREYQKKYYYLNHKFIKWIPCPCDSVAPNFPSDDYYAEWLNDNEFVAQLVQDLVTKFWITHRIYDQFVVTHHSDLTTGVGYKSADGIYPESDYSLYPTPTTELIPHFQVTSSYGIDHSMPSISPARINPELSPEALVSIVQIISNYLSTLEFVEVKVIQTNLEEQWISGYDSDGNCESAKIDAQTYWSADGWGSPWSSSNISISETSQTNPPAPESPPPPTPAELDASVALTEEYGDSTTWASYDAIRGKLLSDLTKHPGTAKIYLKLAGYPTPWSIGPNTPESMSVDSQWHLYQTLDGGNEWQSDYLANGEPEWVTTCPWVEYDTPDGTGKAIWILIDQVAIVEANFDQALRNDGIDPQLAVQGENVKCGEKSCSRCSGGTVNLSLDSLHVNISLGADVNGKSAGYLYIKQETPSAALMTPAKLELVTGESVFWDKIVRDASGFLKEVVAPQIHAKIVIDNQYQYHIDLYHRDSSGNLGAKFKTVTIQNPANSNTDFNTFNVLVSFEDGSSSQQTVFTWNGVDTWQMDKGAGSTFRRENLQKTVDVQNNNRTEIRTIKKNETDIVSCEKKVYHTYPWGEELVEQTIDPAGLNLQTTWEYYCDGVAETDVRYGRLKKETRPNGLVIDHDYTVSGDVRLETVTKGDEVEEITEDRSQDLNGDAHNDLIEMTVEKKSGQEIARRYKIYCSVIETATTQDVWDIRCTTAGALSVENLTDIVGGNTQGYWVTRTALIINPGGFDDGKIRSVENPDGTMSLYEYSSTQTIVKTGKPNSGKTDIEDGTRKETTLDVYGTPTSVKIYDVVSNQLIASEMHSNPDELNRYQWVDYLNGTSTQTQYDCCGIESQTDQGGATTSYEYDEFHRVKQLTRAGVTTLYDYDAMGRVLKEWRKVGTAVAVKVREDAYDTAGRLTSSIDAMNQTTAYDEQINATTGITTKTTTYPNGTFRYEEYDQVGRLIKVHGGTDAEHAAVHGVSYEYGVDQGMQYVKEIKLNTNGTATSEWTKTYSDLLGRTVKVVYPDGAFVQSFYNAKGQLVKQEEPHYSNEWNYIVTLYQYNNKGELELAAIDMNHNGTIDLTGVDRVTRITNDIVTVHDTTVRRTTTEVYTMDNVETLQTVSVQEIDLAGLKSWSTVNGLTTSNETTLTPASQTRVVKVTKPDETSSESTYANGRLTLVVNKDSADVQTAKTEYTYDVFDGDYRIATMKVTDGNASHSRTTTYNDYDAVGRPTIVTVRTTDGTGQTETEQTTTYQYDTMGRQVLVDGPDATGANSTTFDDGVVHYEYHPTGELKKTWGARTYAVEYTYDYAGRQQMMKTSGQAGDEITTWNYNTRGFLSNKRYSDNKGPGYTYTGAGKLKVRTWARGVTTTYGYNNAGDLVRVDYSDTTPDITFQYDRRGRKSTVVDAVGRRSFTYDPVTGQLATEIMPMEAYTVCLSYTYDNFGRRSGLNVRLNADLDQNGVVDAVDNTAYVNGNYSMDVNNDGVIDAADQSAFSWTIGERLSSGVYQYGYDNASRLEMIADRAPGEPGRNTVSYDYKDNSNLIETITYRLDGQIRLVVTRTYDKLNRLLSVTSDPSNGDPVTRTYEYNQANQRIKQTQEDDSTWNYGYDGLGQLGQAKHKFDETTFMPGEQFEYDYDAIGNRTQVRFGGDAAGENLTAAGYTSNLLNQYSQRTVPGRVDVMGYAYNDNDIVRINSSTADIYRNGKYFQKALTYNNSSSSVDTWITSEVQFANPKPPTVIADNADLETFYYTNNAWTVQTDPASAVGPDYRQAGAYKSGQYGSYAYSEFFPDFSHTGKYKLYMTWPAATGRSAKAWLNIFCCSNSYTATVNEQTNLPPGDPWSYVNQYDFQRNALYNGCVNAQRVKIGNIDADDGVVIADAFKFVPDTMSEKRLIHLAKTPQVFTYDADGNLTCDQPRTYQYDAENRIKWAINGTTYAYDYLGRRYYKDPSGGNDFYYIYDGWNLVAELGINKPWSLPTAWTLYTYRTHLWGPDLSGSLQGAGGIGGLLVTEQYEYEVGNVHYPMYDGNGNVIGLVKSKDGTISAQYDYSPYGELLTSSTGSYAGLANPFRFSTKYYDDETGFYYFGYRYYNPETGRWLSRDRIEEFGGINLYGYVRNGPANYCDPRGLVTWDEITGTIYNLPGAYVATAYSGEQISSVSGYVSSLTQSVNPFGYGIDMGPLYDQTVAYESGQEVGSATGTVENVVLLAAGIEGGVNGARALLQTLRQSSALTFTGEGALAVEGLAGTSVAIDQIGQGGTAAGLGIWNLSQNANDVSSPQPSRNVNEGITSANSPVWQEAEPYKGKIRMRGKGKCREYLRWDQTHRDIEVYDRYGRPLGSADPVTGKIYRPPQNDHYLDLK
jgi:RHS repeat-associated protein